MKSKKIAQIKELYESYCSIKPTLSSEESLQLSKENDLMILSHIKGEISDEEYLEKAHTYNEKIKSTSLLLGKDSEVLRILLFILYGEDRKKLAEEDTEHEITHSKKLEERNLDWSFGVLKFTDNIFRPFVFGDLKEETIKWSPIERIKFRLECTSAPENLSDGDQQALEFWTKTLEVMKDDRR